LMRKGQRGRANLELARIAAGYKPLAGLAALEFSPAEDSDWKDALRLARTVREKTELWRMVGIRKDGIVAIQEILKLDPKSNLIGLLMVRELAKAEGGVISRYPWAPTPDPKTIAAQRKAYAQLEQIAIGQLARGGDRPWLMELIAGHIAAKRGDLATARVRLARAVTGNTSDPRVGAQARASLAIALATTWKLGDASAETELATAMAGLDTKFGRLGAVKFEVRSKLAAVHMANGKLIDAEYLHPGTVDPYDWENAKPLNKTVNWQQATFIKDMLARGQRKSTPFERFVVEDSFTQDQLKLELGLRQLFDGDFAGAMASFNKANSKKFGVDPFVIHIKDCHDCDQEKYAKSPWDHVALAKRLYELEVKYKGAGEAGAEAALAIGNALYNLTFWGNARTATADTHQKTQDSSAALKWYKRAHDLSKNRELKVKAAFMAAKAELGLLSNDETAKDRTPKVWFPIVKQYKNTRYYGDILKECGRFADWAN
jgi:tetratricopeptide (TPR) repeat protein